MNGQLCGKSADSRQWWNLITAINLSIGWMIKTQIVKESLNDRDRHNSQLTNALAAGRLDKSLIGPTFDTIPSEERLYSTISHQEFASIF